MNQSMTKVGIELLGQLKNVVVGLSVTVDYIALNGLCNSSAVVVKSTFIEHDSRLHCMPQAAEHHVPLNSNPILLDKPVL